MPRRLLPAAIALFGCLAIARSAPCDELPRPGPVPTVPWVGAQLVPSPEFVSDPRHGALFGMRWQLTPLLYSFGIYRTLSPWRAFVVEPIVRQSGSTELYFSPEYFGVSGSVDQRFGARTGLRTYLPVVERGDDLSLSFGASWLHWQGRDSVGYEAGAHVLFGFVGAIVTFEPLPHAARWTFTLQLRIF